MVFCPQCGKLIDDGGYPAGQSLECSACGCSFFVNALGTRSHTKRPPRHERMSCGQVAFVAAGVLLLVASMAVLWLLRV